jgi:hypothetical protein
MSKALASIVGLFVASFVTLAAAQTMQPATNTPLRGCVEGRALRIVNGYPACSTTVAPTLTNCGSSASVSALATDFVGQVTWTSLTSACTIILSKDYGANFGCLVQSNSSASLALTPTISTVSGKTQVAVPLTVSLGSGKLTYTCFPV